MTRERTSTALNTGLLLLETSRMSETWVTMLINLEETVEGDSGTESEAG